MLDFIIYTDEENFEDVVLKSKIPVILDFYSEDCAPCNALAPIFENLSEKYNKYIKFVKIFRQQNRNISEKYNIKSSPTVIFFNNGQEVGNRLNGYIRKPDLRVEIENVLGDVFDKNQVNKVECDVLILGGGPAGLSAAIYAGRAKLNTVLIDESVVGGQAANTFHIANYPGTNGIVRGYDLMQNMKSQAISFGTQIHEFKEIFEVDLSENIKRIKTEDTEYFARTVIIATGAEPRKLPAEGEKELRGRGVHYCATCDGAMYQDRRVVVVGGGNSAVEEAVFLTRYATHVTVIHQFDTFQSSKTAEEELFKNKNIDVIWNSEVRKIDNKGNEVSIIIENTKTKEQSEVVTDGIFVYIGMQPKSELFANHVKLDEWGYIIVDQNMATSLPGIFAAGDIRQKSIRQVATAVNDGVIAGIMCEKYLAEKKRTV